MKSPEKEIVPRCAEKLRNKQKSALVTAGMDVRARGPLQWKGMRGGGESITRHEPDVLGSNLYGTDNPSRQTYSGTLNKENSGQKS